MFCFHVIFSLFSVFVGDCLTVVVFPSATLLAGKAHLKKSRNKQNAIVIRFKKLHIINASKFERSLYSYILQLSLIIIKKDNCSNSNDEEAFHEKLIAFYSLLTLLNDVPYDYELTWH